MRTLFFRCFTCWGGTFAALRFSRGILRYRCGSSSQNIFSKNIFIHKSQGSESPSARFAFYQDARRCSSKR